MSLRMMMIMMLLMMNGDDSCFLISDVCCFSCLFSTEEPMAPRDKVPHRRGMAASHLGSRASQHTSGESSVAARFFRMGTWWKMLGNVVFLWSFSRFFL